jgi:NADH dehydrogenase
LSVATRGDKPARGSRPARRPRSHIVIVGANFAGLTAAQRLDRRHAVTVIDRSPWFEWLPNLHELLSGVKRPADLRLPRRRLLARAGHRFVQATVATLDPQSGRLHTTAGRSIDFDACIVAVGGVSETFGVRGAHRHAWPFDGVDGCHAIGRRLAALARRRDAQSVVVVGGGLEGVEALGEILRRYRGHESLRVALVEAGRRLLPGTPASLDAAIRRHAAAFGVHVITGARVTSVTPRSVRLRDGQSLRSDLTIWTAGAAPAPLLSASGLTDGPRQWVRVKGTLQARRFDNVFVAGDAAALPRPLRKQAYHAIEMGECAADNAVRYLAGRRLGDFVPSRKPMLVAFGDLDTFLVAGRAMVASPAFAAAKEAVFQATMARFDSPLRAGALGDLSRRVAGALDKLPLR